MAASRSSIGHAIRAREDCADFTLPLPVRTAIHALTTRHSYRVARCQARANQSCCILRPHDPSTSHVYSHPHVRRNLFPRTVLTSCQASPSERSTSDRSNSNYPTASASVPQPSAASPPPSADQPSGAQGSTPTLPADTSSTGSERRRFPFFQLPPRPRHVPLNERITDFLVNTSTPPIGSYMSEPLTVLHRLDPRVKQVRQADRPKSRYHTHTAHITLSTSYHSITHLAFLTLYTI